jgi:hypothetical protein
LLRKHSGRTGEGEYGGNGNGNGNGHGHGHGNSKRRAAHAQKKPATCIAGKAA